MFIGKRIELRMNVATDLLITLLFNPIDLLTWMSVMIDNLLAREINGLCH